MKRQGVTSWYCETADDIPAGEHWAIIQSTSVHIPGDERSRTNPGHGYPESTQKYLLYRAFLNEEEFKIELASLIQRESHYGSTKYRGMHVEGSYVAETTVSLADKK